MLKRILTTLLVTLILSNTQAQKLIGLGLGYDWAESFSSNPAYANKDIDISFSNSWNDFVLEGREALRYMEGFETIRYNTYVLAGFTTLKDRHFVFDFLGGPCFTFVNEKAGRATYHYINQVNLSGKTSLSLRLSKKNNLFVGLACLFSTYRYISPARFNGKETRGYTGSLLISLTYCFLKESP
ncbi:hypothetical protein CNR22_23670 [Sphingobacteriaceae bacterium]|nr:hypothetical protein CNR22_23670 [Sphingobacteriaceae bacterium]